MKNLYLTLIVFMLVLHAGSLGAQNLGQIFPLNNPWNTDISTWPVHPNSANYIASIGANTSLHPDFGTIYPPDSGIGWGIPYVVVRNGEPKIPIVFTTYSDESDPGPYPIPLTAPIEGGTAISGDRHVISIDIDNRKLYELFHAVSNSATGTWQADSGAVFDLSSNAMRPANWTSADAAGLPILPGLVRHDEVLQGVIAHALRFTVQNTQATYLFPARHAASLSNNPNWPPMGLRVRLKAQVDISGFPSDVQIILTALKKYGMIVADNGNDWHLCGAPDPQWNDANINLLKQIHGSDFEVVNTTGAIAFESVQTSVTPLPALNVRVYPNPWRQDKHKGQNVTFDGLLAQATIAIFTLSGRHIKELHAQSPTVSWDLTNDAGDAVASGVYMYLITDSQGHKIKGKFAVIK